MKNLVIAATVAAVFLAGCAVPRKPVPLSAKFDANEHRAYLTKGAAKVTGQAFLRQQGGGTVTCAGARAVLLPATPYFQESVAILARGQQVDNTNNKPGPANSALLRETRCDAQGTFDFENVPAGRYILMSDVSWTIANARQGGIVKREVDVIEGATNRFLLSDSDR